MAHSMTRARFAPSPTSALHVGGARTAISNWLFAHNMSRAFIIGFDDTDLERPPGQSEAGLLGDLRWLGLDWDEGQEIRGPYSPYRQSERLYTSHYVAARLEKDGKACKCYCTDGEVRPRREKAIEEGGPAIYDGRSRALGSDGRREFENEGRKPSPRFRVGYKEVSHNDIVRGDVPFKDYLALLGWSPGDDTEVTSREDLMRKFSLERVSASPSIFDANKLECMSSQYMKILSAEELVEGVAPSLQETGVEAGEGDFMLNAVLSLRAWAKTYSDLAGKMAAFLEEPGTPDGELEDKVRSDSGRRATDLFGEAVSRMDGADKESARKALPRVLETTGLKKSEVFVPSRAALTGRCSGPEIPIIIEVLGKQRALELLRAASESEAKS